RLRWSKRPVKRGTTTSKLPLVPNELWMKKPPLVAAISALRAGVDPRLVEGDQVLRHPDRELALCGGGFDLRRRLRVGGQRAVALLDETLADLVYRQGVNAVVPRLPGAVLLDVLPADDDPLAGREERLAVGPQLRPLG